jgi:tRNA pseudouridine55 synthase
MDLAARPLWVQSLTLLSRPDPDHVALEMICGKGGYVRSIARDLGQSLGCLGHVHSLRREWSGPFTAAQGISLAEIDRLAQTPELDTWLKPLELGLCDLPELVATLDGATRLRHGNPGSVLGLAKGGPALLYGDEAWASYQGRAVAVGIYRGGELHPTRVFN